MPETPTLVANRLIDMRVVHPAQDNSRVCSKCGAAVGIYPSGRRALEEYPEAKIVCAPCAVREIKPEDEVSPAALWSEIAEEIRDSRKVGEA